MRIYTKTGDDGDTGLFNGKRVRKDDGRVAAYGTVDELSSVLGLYRAEGLFGHHDTEIRSIQEDLFELGSDLATPGGRRCDAFLGERVAFLEERMDRMQAELPELRSFVLPGGGRRAALCHLARCVCRRAERELVSVMEEHDVSKVLLVYLNRLSDYLFVLARIENQRDGSGDVLWSPRT
ncbi:MAG: cob(I)yrinic acid a,c-diamide adenosyltransferase [Planctomycetota bacterium]